jgi:hypothetical protein
MTNRDQAKRALTAQLRRIINEAVMRGEIDGHDALAIHMEIITTMIALVRDPAQRAEFVVTLVSALPQMVEVVHVGGDPRVVGANFGGNA